MPSPLVRRIGRRLAAFGIAILTVVVAVVALLQVPAVAAWAVNRLVALVPLSPGYSLQIGGVSGNWLTGLQLRQVVLRYHRRELVRIERLGASYNPLHLRGPDRRIRSLTVAGGAVVARRDAEGWDIARAIRSTPDTTGGGGGDLMVDRLTVRGLDVAAQLAPDSVARAKGFALSGRELIVGDAQ